MSTAPRTALFISHANPEDNAFARWLGAKLTAMGYEVWADVMRLHGGADWARQLEEALRHRAVKVLLAANPTALDKQGVRNEIQIASEVAKRIGDREFILPLRLAPYDPPFLIAQTQYIDFSRGWAPGFAELLDTLANTYCVQRTGASSMDAWHEAQSIGAAKLIDKVEHLPSSWLRFLALPKRISYYTPPVGFPIDKFQDPTVHQWPMVPHGTGVLTFAVTDAHGLLAPALPARLSDRVETRRFLREGWEDQELKVNDARVRFSDLVNQAFERFFQARGLHAYETSGGRLRWWGDLRTYPLTKIAFHWSGCKKGRRQIIGASGKRGVHWHYAINAQARSSPISHVRLYAGLVFSNNGLDALDDAKRMHRLRRSFAKWRNPRWRDMQLAFLWWLGQGQREIALPISNSQRLRIALQPMMFRSEKAVDKAGADVPDEDDPDLDYEFDEDDVFEDTDAASGEASS